MDKMTGLTRIKYIAYCRSQLPPEEVGSNYADFVEFAKHQLCALTHRLFKDPIWDSYTDEEILVEYFAHDFKDEKKRVDFEKELLSQTRNEEDIDDWLVRNASKPVELEDKIEFSPDSLGD